MMTLRYVTVLVVLAVWSVLGVLFWIPLLVRTIAQVSAALLSSVLTGSSLIPAKHALSQAVAFYSMGFRHAVSLLSDEAESPAASLTDAGLWRVIGEVLYAASFWIATLFLLSHLVVGLRSLRLPFAGTDEPPQTQFTPQLTPQPRRRLGLTFASPPSTTMGIQRGGWFSSAVTTTFRIEVQGFHEGTLPSQSELDVTICNVGGTGMNYVPLLAWYTYEERGKRFTLRWILDPGGDSYKSPDYFLSPGGCKNVTLLSEESAGASVAVAVGVPLGTMYFSPRRDQSFCQIDLSQYVATKSDQQ